MFHALRLPAVLAMTFLLSACLVTPGKFVSTLDIRADRSFTFTYKGEVLVFDIGNEMKGLGDTNSDSGDDDGAQSFDGEPSESSLFRQIAMQNSKIPAGNAGPANNATGSNADEDFSDVAQGTDAGNASGGMLNAETSKAKMEAIAEALSKERGYRSVKYVGGNKFEIDYAITGTLDHGFVYPFNIDAEIVFPFIAIEMRGADKLRVKAPGFANDEGKSSGMGDAKKTREAVDGTFTLTTTAEIVSQNQEDGPTTLPDGRRQIMWRVTPLTKDAPTAVLKVKALP